jgi:hypothetical protein
VLRHAVEARDLHHHQGRDRSNPGSVHRAEAAVLLRADEVIVFDRRREVARHERSTVKGSTTVLLDHYLEILVRKPGAAANH